MDADFIYTKTPAGEEAIRQRTRVMQRNVRMVLILVDGRSSFQDLCLRTGNVKLTENALLELEKGGFIVPLVSGKAEEKKPATVSENPRSAAEKLPSIIPPENTSPPVSPFSPTQGIEIISSMQLSLSAAEHSRAAPAEKAPPLDAPSVLPPPPPPVAPVEDQQEEYPVLSWSVSDLPPPPEAENETPPSPSFSERVKTLLPRGEPADDEPIKLVPRGGKKSLRWSSVLLFLLLLIGVLGLLTVFFPYDSYRPEIEAAMSREIGQTVKLGEIEVVFQPAPAIVLKKVRIAGGRHGFSVNKAVLEPALTSLFSSIKEFRRVSLHGAMFGAEDFPELLSLLTRLDKKEFSVRVGALRFVQTELLMAGLDFSGMEVELGLSGEKQLNPIVFQSADRSLKISLNTVDPGKISAGRAEFILEGLAWKPLPDQPLQIDSVTVKGHLRTDNGLRFDTLEARLLGGVITGGNGMMQAEQGLINTYGDVDFERISGNRLASLIGHAAVFSGDVSGRLHFESTAKDWAAVLPAMVASGNFSIQRGSLKNLDLIEAARRSASGQAVQGGTTSFEQLNGKFQLSSTAYQYSGLLINSGMMHASGHLQNSGKDQISGRLDLQMRGTANQTRIPLAISGPAAMPAVRAGL